MGDRSVFSTEASRAGVFTELTVERQLSDVDLARTHVIGRNRRVGQVLCYLSLMKAAGLLPAVQKTSVVAATVQDFNSSAGNQAAHYLPGQLFVDGTGKGLVEPWKLVKNAATANAIGALFSATQDLHPNFNKADSYVEMYAEPGLKKTFAQACARVLADAPSPNGRANRPSIEAAYGFWITGSLASYRAAIERKIDIAGLDDLPPATAPALDADGTFEPHRFDPAVAELQERAVRKGKSGNATGTVWDFSEQVRILTHYLKTTKTCALSARMLDDVESTFRP